MPRAGSWRSLVIQAAVALIYQVKEGGKQHLLPSKRSSQCCLEEEMCWGSGERVERAGARRWIVLLGKENTVETLTLPEKS